MKACSLCLILLSFQLTTALAQSRFSMGVTAAPIISHTSSNFNFYLPDPNGGMPVSASYAGRTTIGGYLIGLSGQYTFSPSWSVSTGLWYNRLITNGQNPFNPTLETVRFVTQSMQIPLLLNYRLSKKRLSPYFSGGTVANFRRPTLYHSEAGSGRDDFKVEYGKAVVFSAMLGAGVSCQLDRHLSLTVQPLLTWRFKPNSSYDRYTSYQLNGQTQLLYTF